MPNQLIEESSPYLLQHAHNPVQWHAWGTEPFERAKKENKPLLVSIGYAACHWCHVMEHESFENEDVAKYMNEHFINIKVDREEHPAVDHFYMDAVQAISGSGGWPLNVFVTPERIPFYGGTYFPPKPLYGRASWMQVLENISGIWAEKPGDITAQTDQMFRYLQQASKTAIQATGEPIDAETCNLMAENLLKQADTIQGGFGRAPKFPGTMAITYLLEHYHYTGHQPSLDQALLSLDCMIEGGIYDQLGGGFARYATDDAWLIPHFEKMLYDNALLIVSLCDAYGITKKQRYKEVIEETIAFVERELKDATGGYYSALDADSEGIEGKFYTWTWEDWSALINDDIVARHFGVTEHCNWEETNILHVSKTIDQISAETGIAEVGIRERIQIASQKLFEARKARIRPLTDDKSLLSWNALMNIALSKASMVLQNDEYLSIATTHMQWMQDHFQINGQWMHTWKQGKAKIPAHLDDIAYLVKAMLQLSSAAGNNSFIRQAKTLTDTALADFAAEDGIFCYYSSARQNDIPLRKVEVYDGATPSANAVMADNLLLLAMCMEDGEYAGRAYDMLQAMVSSAMRYTYSFGYWAMVAQRYSHKLKTVVCTGINAAKMAQELAQFCFPETFILTSQKEISEIPLLKDKFSEASEALYLCTQESCLAPMSTTTQVLAYLHSNKK